VQLHQVEPVDAEVAARPVDPAAEVLEVVVLRFLVESAAHLGGHGEPGVGMRRGEAADDLLAATVPVDVRGVVERDARLRGGLEDRTSVGLGDVTPVGTELPGAQSHY
jgi:hypothetical protein